MHCCLPTRSCRCSSSCSIDGDGICQPAFLGRQGSGYLQVLNSNIARLSWLSIPTASCHAEPRCAASRPAPSVTLLSGSLAPEPDHAGQLSSPDRQILETKRLRPSASSAKACCQLSAPGKQCIATPRKRTPLAASPRRLASCSTEVRTAAVRQVLSVMMSDLCSSLAASSS